MGLTISRTGALAAAGGLLLAAPAAALQVSVDDGSVSFVVTDDGAGDQAGGGGRIVYDSDLGPGVPAFGALGVQADGCTAACDTLGVSVEADTGGAAGAIVIEVTETGYDALAAPALLAVHSVGGFLDGDVTMEAFYDAGNAPFAKTTSIGGPYAFGAGEPFDSFAEDLSRRGPAFAGPYSLTSRIEVVHEAGDVQSNLTSAATVSAVPLPAAAWLLAAGAAGLGATTLRRRG